MKKVHYSRVFWTGEQCHSEVEWNQKESGPLLNSSMARLFFQTSQSPICSRHVLSKSSVTGSSRYSKSLQGTWIEHIAVIPVDSLPGFWFLSVSSCGEDTRNEPQSVEIYTSMKNERFALAYKWYRQYERRDGQEDFLHIENEAAHRSPANLSNVTNSA